MKRQRRFGVPLEVLAGLPAFLAVMQVFTRLTQDSVDVRVALGVDSSTLVATVEGTAAADAPAPLTAARLVGSVDLEVGGLSVLQRLVTALPPVTVLTTTAVCLYLLSPVVRDLRSGRPFTVTTPRRLTRVAVVVAVGSVLAFATRLWAADVVVDHLGTPARGLLEGTPVIDLLGLLVAYVFLVLAEAGWYGKRLADDVEGLV